MKRLTAYIFAFVTGALILIEIATGIIWIRSHHYGDLLRTQLTDKQQRLPKAAPRANRWQSVLLSGDGGVGVAVARVTGPVLYEPPTHLERALDRPAYPAPESMLRKLIVLIAEQEEAARLDLQGAELKFRMQKPASDDAQHAARIAYDSVKIWTDRSEEFITLIRRRESITGTFLLIHDQLGPSKEQNVWVAVFPYWALMIALSIAACACAITPIRYLRSISRAKSGRCRNCGYDLRATPDRCPECGTVPSKPAEVAK